MNGQFPITNSQDLIELQEIRDRIDWIEIDFNGEENGEELSQLKTLLLEAHLGGFLIRESEWKNYVTEEWQPVVEDSRLPDFLRNNIDWQGAADDLATELNSVDFDGVNYYVV